MSTDSDIRAYVRLHWRDPWLGGGPGKGTVNDAAIILFSETTSPEGKARIRAEFARLLATQPTNETRGR